MCLGSCIVLREKKNDIKINIGMKGNDKELSTAYNRKDIRKNASKLLINKSIKLYETC